MKVNFLFKISRMGKLLYTLQYVYRKFNFHLNALHVTSGLLKGETYLKSSILPCDIQTHSSFIHFFYISILTSFLLSPLPIISRFYLLQCSICPRSVQCTGVSQNLNFNAPTMSYLPAAWKLFFIVLFQRVYAIGKFRLFRQVG